MENSKILMLTNKTISQKNAFEYLYKVFDDRFVDVSDRIENYLKLIQALDICELCYLYKNRNYNPLIKQIRAGGFVISKGQDKITLKEHIKHFMKCSDLSISQAIAYAKDKKLIKETEAFRKTITRNNEFLINLENNEQYKLFKSLYTKGQNTFTRIKDSLEVKSEEEFESLEYQFKSERFINTIFSTEIEYNVTRERLDRFALSSASARIEQAFRMY